MEKKNYEKSDWRGTNNQSINCSRQERFTVKLLPQVHGVCLPLRTDAQVLTRLPHINTLNVADNRLTDRCGQKSPRYLVFFSISGLLGYCCKGVVRKRSCAPLHFSINRNTHKSLFACRSLCKLCSLVVGMPGLKSLDLSSNKVLVPFSMDLYYN